MANMRPAPLSGMLGRAVTIASEVYQVSQERVISPTRLATAVDARQATYWAMRLVGGYSYSELGRMFGRDHSTIIHGVKRCAALRGPQKRKALQVLTRLSDWSVSQCAS